MIDYNEIRARLRIDKHRLDDELEIQAEVQDQLGQHASALGSEASYAKEKLARCDAELLLEYKSSYEKCTESQIKALIYGDKKRIALWDRAQEARNEYEAAATLLEAWKQRGYAMKTLADLYGSSYFAPRSFSTSDRTPVRLTAEDRAPIVRTRRRGV